jgi:transcriptional regulator with XRE-family HTH domain
VWFDDIDIGGRGIVQPAQGPLGRALRYARYDVLLSQQRLADLAGVSQSAVSRLERGADSWRLFCRLTEVIGGEPVVTIELLPAARERFGSRDDDWW